LPGKRKHVVKKKLYASDVAVFPKGKRIRKKQAMRALRSGLGIYHDSGVESLCSVILYVNVMMMSSDLLFFLALCFLSALNVFTQSIVYSGRKIRPTATIINATGALLNNSIESPS